MDSRGQQTERSDAFSWPNADRCKLKALLLIDGVLQLDLPPSGDDRTGARPFVIGPENALLAEPLRRLLAADSLAEAARLFNPLVLVGPAGSGKSQLAQALIRRWCGAPHRHGEPDRPAVAYFTAVDFGREAQAAAADDRLAAWQAQVRGVQLLVIEDLDRLRPRATIHLQLRGVLDAALQNGAVVVVTSQREPAGLPQLDPGVRDRLAAGLTIRMQSPGLAARSAILRAAAAAQGAVLDEAQLALLASREAASPAEVLGRLARAAACRKRSHHAPADVAAAAHPAPHEDRDRLRRLIAVAARYFGVTQAAILGPSRRSSLVKIRNIIVHLARRHTELSYADIGRQLGGRDHTTIMHADRRLAEQRRTDVAVENALDELDRLVT